MHRRGLGALWAAAVLCCGVTAAESPSTADIGALGQALRDNQLALREYAWTARTQIRVDGELESRRVYRVTRDPNGRVERKLLEDEDVAAGKGRSKGKQRKFEERILELRELLDAYTGMSPPQAREAFAGARGYEDPPGSGSVRLQMRGVVYQGDSMDVWVDAVTGHPSRFEVFTALYGKAVSVSVRFEELPGAHAVPVLAVVRTEDEKEDVEIRVEIFDHARR